jgi:hypothetical protein
MKRQITLDDYHFYKGDLTVIFKLDDDKYREDIIDENSFEEYIQQSGRLEYFEDCWDGHRESHYTKEYLMEYDAWKKDECQTTDIEDFLCYHYQNNKIPDYLEE